MYSSRNDCFTMCCGSAFCKIQSNVCRQYWVNFWTFSPWFCFNLPSSSLADLMMTVGCFTRENMEVNKLGGFLDCPSLSFILFWRWMLSSALERGGDVRIDQAQQMCMCVCVCVCVECSMGLVTETTETSKSRNKEDCRSWLPWLHENQNAHNLRSWGILWTLFIGNFWENLVVRISYTRIKKH